MILTIFTCLFIVDCGAYFASGRQRFQKWKYLLPCIGGWMALRDRLK